ncbi:DUF3604 domain-containing protein [Criblamydia sequanensis]|uniref:DUF3604 domain-containing protein n=1 Tax=Candidatus Criblamydia sequanensis CRIB-18 TaxID=1437425 RepID=A0A090D2Z9_9BACT|nr:DUF3604 domain-containing protein [Criblamydia sequanensis]CDR35095.1 Conserved hypothetical protein [Criblamydia sequanensis CRIB-18]
MRRSICYCEPQQAAAGEINTWKFIYTPANKLPKGTLIKFDLASEGRSIDWEIPSTDLKESRNVIYCMLENGKILPFKEIDVEWRFTPQYELQLPQEIDVGSPITIICGAPKGKSPTQAGNMAQCTTQRRKNFNLYIDTSGKGRFGEPEVFNMDIKGSTLKNIKVWAPSFAIKNHRFDVIVRFEDEFGNLTSNAPEDTLIELSYENLRENLNWKLFVPETGFITLPNLYFNEAGIYTIQLRNAATGEVFRASPIKCFAEPHDHLFWGLLHGESERIDSAENIEGCLRHFRDEKALSFFSSSHFESMEETSNDLWKSVVQNITDFDENDRFTTFIGFQWNGDPGIEGARQFIFTKDGKQILRRKDAKGTTLKKIYKSFSPKELLSIPTFTQGSGTHYNFNDFNPEFERVVEIYNAWGSSENLKKDDNPRPIETQGKKGVKETAEGSIIGALKRNFRFGFVAGGLDDRGIYADFFDGDQVQYSAGLTAIIAKEQSRTSLAEALYKRSCYATTGERMLLGYSIAGTSMGGEISTADKPGLIINRHISGYAAGTTALKKIEIIRNGEVIHTIHPKNTYHQDFAYDDSEDLSTIALDAKDKKPPFVFYYVRVTQEDGHIAWGSPLWIDYVKLSPSERKAKRALKAVSTKVQPKVEMDDFSLDDEEEEEEEAEVDFDDDDDESDA